jgi:hypothetical protein
MGRIAVEMHRLLGGHWVGLDSMVQFCMKVAVKQDLEITRSLPHRQ